MLVLGPRELTAAALRRLTRYLEAHPLTVVVAVGADPAGARPRSALRAAGVTLVVKGEPTVGKLTTALRKASARRRRPASPPPPSGSSRPPRPRTDGRRTLEDRRARARETRCDDEPGTTTSRACVEVERELAPTRPDSGEDDDDLDRPARSRGVAIDAPLRRRGHADPAAAGSEAVVLTVASATGGCGKTFFATNLAALVARGGHRALLVDLDLQFGEVAAALRVSHPYSVYDGLYDPQGRPLPDERPRRPPRRSWCTTTRSASTCSPPRATRRWRTTSARATPPTSSTPSSSRYDVVIVDTPPSLNEVVLTALDRSDVVAVLATLDVPALKNLTVFLDTLRRLKIDDGLLRLVLNKVEPDVGIDVKQAQNVFGDRFVGQIPQSRAVSRSHQRRQRRRLHRAAHRGQPHGHRRGRRHAAPGAGRAGRHEHAEQDRTVGTDELASSAEGPRRARMLEVPDEAVGPLGQGERARCRGDRGGRHPRPARPAARPPGGRRADRAPQDHEVGRVGARSRTSTRCA